MAAGAPQIELRSVDALVGYARNARTHSPEQVRQLKASMLEFGWTNAVLADAAGIVAGHGRVMAARELLAEGKSLRFPNGSPIPPGMVPVVDCSGWTETQRRAYILADNKLALESGWDDDMLQLELRELQGAGFDLDAAGWGDDGLGGILGEDPEAAAQESADRVKANGALADRFLIPPFSILNARDKRWQDRKNAWLSLGIASEMGRKDGLTYAKGRDVNDPTLDDVSRKLLSQSDGTSIFDPVLAELAYTWFCPPGGLVLDPFAGGSVRGLVAGRLGRRYVGVDLRPEQVAANRDQVGILGGAYPAPEWRVGNSCNIDALCGDVEADFVFSCPPYADLEVYSDDPQDLSNMGYAEFREAYFRIIRKACARLKNDRFAAFVVGEVRSKRGTYYNFVGDTIQAFLDAGLSYYNETILVTMIGSLPVRAGKQFSASRKIGKTHQNVLVFCKGSTKRATEACGEVVCGGELRMDDEAKDDGETDDGEPF